MIKQIIKKITKKLLTIRYEPLYYTKNLKRSYWGTSVCAGELKGKNVIITGGGGGIGIAIAQRMVMEGCNVLITGRNEKKLQKAIEQLTPFLAYHENEKRILKYVVWDQEEISDIERKFNEIIQLFPGRKLDILVNNAGVFTENDRKRIFRTLEIKEFEHVMRINYESAYILSKLAIQTMIKQNVKGNIVTIASVCANTPQFMYTPYGISKAQVMHMIKRLDAQYNGYGITVNGIAPGSVVTDMGNWQDGDNIFKKNNILNRVVLPEEIAGLVALLSSEYGKYLHGEVICAAAEEIFK